MDASLEHIRNQQKETWNRFSSGWKKWDTLTMRFLQPMGEEIIGLIRPQPENTVLDIASGTGEPALTIARMVKAGKVVLTDISDGMLEVAKEHAVTQGLSNIEVKVCDVSELPFEDNSFDLVSCRMGFMFFPDMQAAANEIYRVLKPGGRFATSVWDGPDKNAWVTSMMAPLNRILQIPPPAPETPSMFRCARPGLIHDLLEHAGFKHVTEKEISGTFPVHSSEEFWNFQTEVAAPVVSALGKTDAATREKIKNEVFDGLHQRFPDGNLALGFNALVVYGEK